MKFSKTQMMLLLALAGAGFLAPSATAVVTSYTPGDLFLGFRASGGTQDYLVNIGQASIYRDALPGSVTVPNVGAIALDLVDVFGPTWFSRGDLFWGVAGTSGSFSAVGSDPAKTLYASREEVSLGTQAAPWTIASSTLRGTTTTKLVTMAGVYNGASSTGNSDFGVIQQVVTDNSDPLNPKPAISNPWASYQPGGTAPNSGGIGFAAFNPTIEGSFANGALGTALDLFRNENNGSPFTYEGTFTINNLGVVTFTNPIPEPASLALLGGALSLLAIRRRRA